MGNMNTDLISQLLTIALIFVIVLLFILIMVYIILKLKKDSTNKTQKEKNTNIQSMEVSDKGKSNLNSWNKQSIFNFMEFDRVEDNMIIQKDGVKYLMIVECQGVNYDLMSGVEKTGVEEGFVQFLNTLRHPIQIYTQTRTINLENSINTYKNKVKDIESKLIRMKQDFQEMKKSENYTKEQLDRAFFEITKQTNLLEYGRDIIYNTEKMSLNKNILSKKYYIVIPYYTSELGNNEFDKAELRNIAFSELYTRSQSVIRTLSVCGVNGKIMNSSELIELLYIAYNRDEAEVFGLDKALKAGFDELYVTAPDVLDKKMYELDKLIEDKAIQKANEKVEQARSAKQKAVEQKQESVDDLIDELAKTILEANSQYVGEDIAKNAIESIENDKKGRKGVKKDVQKERKTRKSTKSA